MKNGYIILLSSIVFTISWYGSRHYQIRTNEVEFNKSIAPSYKGVIGSEEVREVPIWDKFTEEEKVRGVYGYNK